MFYSTVHPHRHHFISLTCLDVASVQKHVVVHVVGEDDVQNNSVLGL